MTKSKWKITTIILLTAVFVSLIVLLVIQSVNNSRLLDYLLDERVRNVTYSRYNDTSLMLYSLQDNEVSDDGIMLLADGDLDISTPSSVFTITNNYSSNGTVIFTLSNYSVEDVDSDPNYCAVTLRKRGTTTAIATVDIEPYQRQCTFNLSAMFEKGSIESGVAYEFYVDAYMFKLKNGAAMAPERVQAVFSTFTLTRTVLQDLPTPPTKIGYTFTGWYTDEACTNLYTEDKVTGDISLYAGFRAHTYTVKFNANNSNGTMSDLSMTYDKAVNLPTSEFTKEHYIFVGWATSADGTVTYADSQSVKNVTSTDNGVVTLFAIFERSEWVVTYDVDGVKTTSTVAVNTAITLPESPNKEGYTFAGWAMSNGTEYTNQPVTSDITLTAKFEIIRCKITFYVDGSIYGTYECDYGTNVSELLLVTGVNPVLYRLAPASLDGVEIITADNTADLELTSIGEVVSEDAFPWVAAGLAFAVILILSVSITFIVKAVKH